MSIKITYDDRQVVKAAQAGLAAIQNLGPAMADIEGELLAISDKAFWQTQTPRPAKVGQRWNLLP